MSRLARVLRRSPAERRLLVQSYVLLWAIVLGLRLFPLRVVRHRLAQLTTLRGNGGGRAGESPAAAQRLAWAVRAASRYVPRSTCLAQALAARTLLEWYGHPGRLHLGVARSPHGQLEAHAWVESEGTILVGGPEVERYTPLLALDGGSP